MNCFPPPARSFWSTATEIARFAADAIRQGDGSPLRIALTDRGEPLLAAATAPTEHLYILRELDAGEVAEAAAELPSEADAPLPLRFVGRFTEHLALLDSQESARMVERHRCCNHCVWAPDKTPNAPTLHFGESSGEEILRAHAATCPDCTARPGDLDQWIDQWRRAALPVFEIADWIDAGACDAETALRLRSAGLTPDRYLKEHALELGTLCEGYETRPRVARRYRLWLDAGFTPAEIQDALIFPCSQQLDAEIDIAMGKRARDLLLGYPVEIEDDQGRCEIDTFLEGEGSGYLSVHERFRWIEEHGLRLPLHLGGVWEKRCTDW
jgi:hypothetical protein